MKNIEYLGYWWLFLELDKKIVGILKFMNDEGIKLWLIGLFFNFYIVGKIFINIFIILGIVYKNIMIFCNFINFCLRRSFLVLVI